MNHRSTKLETLKLPVAVKKRRFLKALVALGAFLVAFLVADRLLGLILRLVDSANSVGFSVAAIFFMFCISAYLWITLSKKERL